MREKLYADLKTSDKYFEEKARRIGDLDHIIDANSKISEVTNELANIGALQNHLARVTKDVKLALILCGILFSAGALISWAGFRRWYFRKQILEDILLENQAKAIKNS
jgi:hypothetical protein